MKLTFAAFLIAAASLSGIPPFSGFWSKDAVLGSAWVSGQYALFAVGAVTAGLTAFYSFRMLGLVFFGGKSQRLEQVEAQGHHVHEPSPIMWVPYTVLAVATVVIGLAALAGEAIPSLNVQATLESAASGYISYLYPVQSLPAPSAALDPASSGIALVFVALGFFAAASFYLTRRMSPSALVGQAGFMHSIYVFLEKRWYINAVYYKVFVNAPAYVAKWLSETFDNRGLFRVNDAGSVVGEALSEAGNWLDVHVVDGAANGFSSWGQALSRVFRRLQTGVVEQYVQVFAAGLLVLIIFFLLAVGGYIR